nr:TetR/AcrR family transcriptional regulator [Glycomyces amatae]
MAAAVTLVSARGTANVPVSEIADAAGVSRQLVYLHYGDRDTLLFEAALDLARRELADPWGEAPAETISRERALAVTRHFAAHRGFYRAMFESSSAYALNQVVSALLAPLRSSSLRVRFGSVLPPRVADDLGVFITGGGTALMHAWVASCDEVLDPESMADRLLAVGEILTGALEGIQHPVPAQRAGD